MTQMSLLWTGNGNEIAMIQFKINAKMTTKEKCNQYTNIILA